MIGARAVAILLLFLIPVTATQAGGVSSVGFHVFFFEERPELIASPRRFCFFRWLFLLFLLLRDRPAFRDFAGVGAHFNT